VRDKLIVVFHKYFERFHVAEKHKIMATAIKKRVYSKQYTYQQRHASDRHYISEHHSFTETLSMSCLTPFKPSLNYKYQYYKQTWMGGKHKNG
jgi:hypothetical protein